MELFIGREPETFESVGGRLQITLSNIKRYIGAEKSVPNCVSRQQHCKIVIKKDGSMSLVNLKPNNITYVNGLEAVKTTITESDIVELGCNRYKLDLKEVLKAVDDIIPKVYDISHLKVVWEKYQQDKLDLQIKQSRSAAIQSITGILSMFSIACGFIPGTEKIRPVLYGIAIVLAIIFFIYRLRHAGENVIQLKELDDQFRKDYVCPNPDCHHFLGYIPFDELVKQAKSCNVCKCLYEVKE